jgi:hypothetical protein
VPDTLARERAREARDLVAQLPVREDRLRVRDRRVVDQRGLVGAAALDMAVERVRARVHPAAREPAVERRARVVEHALPWLHPVEQLGRVTPERLGLLERTAIDLGEPSHPTSTVRVWAALVNDLPSRFVDRDEYRRTSLANWQTMAAGWERQRAHMETVTSRSGTGSCASSPRSRARRSSSWPPGPGTQVLLQPRSSGRGPPDQYRLLVRDDRGRSPARAGARPAERRLPDDGRRSIDLDDDSVDGVICRFGFMLMSDTEAALAETRPRPAPGCRLVFATWRGPELNPWVAIGGRILTARGLMPPNEPGAPGMFTMADDERVESLLTARASRTC